MSQTKTKNKGGRPRFKKQSKLLLARVEFRLTESERRQFDKSLEKERGKGEDPQMAAKCRELVLEYINRNSKK